MRYSLISNNWKCGMSGSLHRTHISVSPRICKAVYGIWLQNVPEGDIRIFKYHQDTGDKYNDARQVLETFGVGKVPFPVIFKSKSA